MTRVLAIDPGFDRMGVAILEKETLLFSACIQTDPKRSRPERLLVIGSQVREIIDRWRPGALAVETLFFNENRTSAIGVAEARGTVIYEAARAGLPVFEYGPQAVKVAVTGYGKADKRQVAEMVKKLVVFPTESSVKIDDEIDAVALGITHLASRKGV